MSQDKDPLLKEFILACMGFQNVNKISVQKFSWNFCGKYLSVIITKKIIVDPAL